MNNRFEWGREQALREEIVRVGRLMYDRGLVVGNDGNLSVRLDENHVLCTPSGLCKGMMTPDQMIVIDMQGRKVGQATAANRNLGPTSEVPMHLEVYHQRPDVEAVVHAHPPLTVALSIAGVTLSECMLPEVIVNLGLVPTASYATPASEENVHAIRSLIGSHDGIILQRHGSLTVGSDLMAAFMRLESLEQIAKITVILQILGRGAPLQPDQVEKLLEQRQRMGLSHIGEWDEFSQFCGVPAQQSLLDGRQACPFPEEPSQDEELVRSITQAVLRELGHAG